MKAKSLALLVVALAIGGTASAAVTTLNYVSTKGCAVGSTGYTSPNGHHGWGALNYNQNYSADVGWPYRICNGGDTDYQVMDFDRAGLLAEMEADVVAAHPGLSSFHFTSVSQFAGNVKIYLNLMPAGDFESVATQTGEPFDWHFAPAVRLSAGQNWVESEATFVQAANGKPWNDKNGNPMNSANGVNCNNLLSDFRAGNFLAINATSQRWDAADSHGGNPFYEYNRLRPWQLDDSVAWTALEDPAAVGFQLIQDWPADQAECIGRVYSHRSGDPGSRPQLTVVFDPSSVLVSQSTFLPADFNRDHIVNFKDYIVLESNFGKTQATNAMGDADADGLVTFKDYIVLESSFNKTTTPEPATMGLLIAGGLALLRRKA